MDLLTKYETLKKIKHYNPNIYVIMVADQMEYSPEALKYGAFDYLQKDSNELNQIRKVLQKITGIKHLLGKKYNSFQ
jgi:response regulator of citrate/malate metabolism